MSVLLSLSRSIDAVNGWIGRQIAWLILVAVLVSAANAIVRKLFDMSSNAWLELQWVLFGAVFLLCSPWTLASNEHVRIDIVSNLLSRRTRDLIDIAGHVFFLLPMAGAVVYMSWPFFISSAPRLADLQEVIAKLGALSLRDAWVQLALLGEQSLNAGGLPQWPAKLLIPVAFMLLFVQGISELIKRVAIVSGCLHDVHAAPGPQPGRS
jgi:TRAP-type mannitol/chloroaromatic compound transport system permease small subunit